jgi:DNA-binding SARP family transcriptional activator
MSRLEIEILGEARFRFDGRPWRLTAPPKCLPLLALLLVDAEPQQRSALASSLWPEESDRIARANLRRHLHALTRALPQLDGVVWIEADATSVRWNPNAPARSDVGDFLASVVDASTRSDATQFYRGELLSGSFDEAIVGLRERFAAQHIALLAELATAAKAERSYHEAIAYAEAALAIDEWREDMVRLLMLVRHAAGDRSGALATFERFARQLRDQLRTEPMFETTALRDAILSGTLPAESDAPPPAAAVARTLVGRTSELDALHAHWLRAARGNGTTTFIFGEAGIGKTTLTLELHGTVEAQGGRAVIGRTSKPESVPYQPIVEALRQVIPFVKPEPRDDRWLAALQAIVPEVRRLNDGLPEPARLEGERARLRLNDAFARAFEACSRVRPLTIILEDLHYAQTDTIDAIGALAEAIATAPILLIVTYRSTEATADSPVRALRRRLARSSLANQVSLGRLAAHDVRAIVAASNVAEGEDFADAIFSLSEGNPLFTWQLIHDRIEGGASVQSEVHTVSDAIRRRLEHVDPQVRIVAEVAATIGDAFTVEEIAEVGGWSEAAVFGALADLLDRQLVSERAGASFEYGFTHALIRGAIYDASGPVARQMRHRRAADVLAQTRTERGGVLPLIAAHWLSAGETELARATLLRAAQSALESHARHDAHDNAMRALALDATPQERLELLRVIVRAADKRADLRVTEKILEEFETLAASLGRSARFDALITRIAFHNDHGQRHAQAEVAARLAAFLAPSDPPAWRIESVLQTAIVAMQRGETAAGEAMLGPLDRSTITEPRQIQLCYSTLAQSLVRQGKYVEGEALLAEFRAYLDAHPSLDGEWLYAYSVHKKTWLTDDSSVIARTATRLIEIAQQRGDVTDEAAGLMDLATIKHNLHDTANARRDYHRAMELWARAAQWQGWSNTIVNLGEAECEIGHYERAIACWEQGKLRGLEAGARFAPIIADINLADLELMRGENQAALERVAPLPKLLEGTGEQRSIGETEVSVGRALCACGQIDEGLALMHHGLGLLRPMVQGRWRASLLAHYIEAMIAHERTEHLEMATRELETIFDEDPHDHVSPARICLALAASARFNGDTDRAQAFIERGREAVAARLDALTDKEDRAAFVNVAANRAVLEGSAPQVSRSR